MFIIIQINYNVTTVIDGDGVAIVSKESKRVNAGPALVKVTEEAVKVVLGLVKEVALA